MIFFLRTEWSCHLTHSFISYKNVWNMKPSHSTINEQIPCQSQSLSLLYFFSWIIKYFYMFLLHSNCTNTKNMSITVEVLNKSSCFIYGAKRHNKMTTNEKHNINKDKLKCVRMKHKESPMHKFFLFRFTFVLRVWSDRGIYLFITWNASIFTLFFLAI